MERMMEGVWTVHELLTPEECSRLMKRAEERGLTPTATDSSFFRTVYRDCLRAEFDDGELANAVWKRLQTEVPQELLIGDDDSELPAGVGADDMESIRGRWTPCGINARWRVVCYPGKGHFSPHRDSEYVRNENERSFLTINGYLTALPSGNGGATRFLEDDQPADYRDDQGRYAPRPGSVVAKVEPDHPGKAVLFFHKLMHDGEPLEEGSPPKWLFRTEVVYRRDPSTVPSLSADQKEARTLLRDAQLREEEGKFAEAAKLYNKAFKLDHTLERTC